MHGHVNIFTCAIFVNSAEILSTIFDVELGESCLLFNNQNAD